jgi:hypothetical protein
MVPVVPPYREGYPRALHHRLSTAGERKNAWRHIRVEVSAPTAANWWRGTRNGYRHGEAAGEKTKARRWWKTPVAGGLLAVDVDLVACRGCALSASGELGF